MIHKMINEMDWGGYGRTAISGGAEEKSRRSSVRNPVSGSRCEIETSQI
jgi:hypothetical protein